MANHKLHKMFQKMSQAYAALDFDAIAGYYDLPGALYLGCDVIVWPDKAALTKFLKRHCSCNYALGARSVEARVIAQSIANGTHFSAWVSWHHLNEQGACIFTTQVRYFLRRKNGGSIVIQLAEVLERPVVYDMPDVPRPFRADEPAKKHIYLM